MDNNHGFRPRTNRIPVPKMKNANVQLARRFIVDAEKEDLTLRICNAVSEKDESQVRQLLKDNSILGGEVLLDMLHNFEVASALVMAGVELNFQDATSIASPLNILLWSDHPRKLELAELMFDRGAICTFDDEHCTMSCALKAGASDSFLLKVIRNSGDDFETCALAIIKSKERQNLMLLLVTAGLEDEATIRSEKARCAIIYMLHSKSCDAEVVRALLQYDLDVDTPDDIGRTTLYQAIEMANTKVAELYLQRGADPNRKSGEGQLPLWIASSMEDSSMAALLIRHGADVHDCNSDDQRPIHGACKGHSLSNTFLLIRLGADVNVVGRKGITPLSLLAEKNSPNKDALYAFVTRQLALVASRGVKINEHDMQAIEKSRIMKNLFDLSFQEAERMQRMEDTEGIPYHTFLIGNVARTARFVRRDDFTNIFENQERLKTLFPCYFCDLRNAYVFAKEREGRLMAKEKLLSGVLSEIYQIPVPDFIVNKIANYACIDEINNFMRNFFSCTFSSMIWK